MNVSFVGHTVSVDILNNIVKSNNINIATITFVKRFEKTSPQSALKHEVYGCDKYLFGTNMGKSYFEAVPDNKIRYKELFCTNINDEISSYDEIFSNSDIIVFTYHKKDICVSMPKVHQQFISINSCNYSHITEINSLATYLYYKSHIPIDRILAYEIDSRGVGSQIKYQSCVRQDLLQPLKLVEARHEIASGKLNAIISNACWGISILNKIMEQGLVLSSLARGTCYFETLLRLSLVSVKHQHDLTKFVRSDILKNKNTLSQIAYNISDDFGYLFNNFMNSVAGISFADWWKNSLCYYTSSQDQINIAKYHKNSNEYLAHLIRNSELIRNELLMTPLNPITVKGTTLTIIDSLLA